MHYDLFIIIGMDRFSFLIADGQSNVLVLKSHVFDPKTENIIESIRAVYISEEQLKAPYRSVKIGLINNENTFIPDHLFNQNDAEAYLATMIDSRADKNIHTDHLRPLHSYQIYKVDNDLELCLQQYFPESRIFHVMSPLVLGLKQIASHQSGKKVYVYVRSRVAHIFLFEDHNFLFANSFHFQTDKDFIYFTLLIYNQFQLDTSTVPLYYAGFILENSQIYHQLYRYIRFLHPVPRPVFFKYGKKSQQVYDHFFFDLYSLKLCE
jgi:Protein of unknown function (DUF3822)